MAINGDDAQVDVAEYQAEGAAVGGVQQAQAVGFAGDQFKRGLERCVDRVPITKSAVACCLLNIVEIRIDLALIRDFPIIDNQGHIVEALFVIFSRRIYEEHGMLVDPHTAVGVAAARRAGRWESPLVVLATAHPAKFPEAVEAAIGRQPALHPRAHDLFDRDEKIDHLPADAEAVKAYVRAFVKA